MAADSFDDVRVLELGAGVSAAFAARLFTDRGADVWSREPTRIGS